VKLTIKYPFLPKARSLATGLVMDTFGVDFDQGEHVICDQLELPIIPKQIVLFTGPSGSGKSSLLRDVVRQFLPLVNISSKSTSSRYPTSRWSMPFPCPPAKHWTSLLPAASAKPSSSFARLRNSATASATASAWRWPWRSYR